MAKQASARFARSARSIEQALALHRQGRLDEADRIYGEVLAADPRHFDALHLSGMLRHHQGRSVEALRLVAAALKAKHGAADALMNYGVILLALERYEEALASFDRLLAKGAGGAALHYNRGNALKGLSRYEEALASYDRALALAPDLAVAHHNRGSTLAELDRNEEALASFDRALARAGIHADPSAIAALTNRGKVLTRLKRYDEALPSYDTALALCPDDADALTNRGDALNEIGRLDEALATYEQALRVAPDIIDAHINRGNTFIKLKRVEEALRCYSDALAIDPENPDANFNEALTRLCMGDFRLGWKKYEYRWTRKKYAVRRPSYPRPLWRGEKELHGKTIFLHAEQGLGDAIQFSRYAPLVAALGAKVLLGVHRPLTALMASVAGVSQVLADGDAVPDFDLYCSLLSLPLAFETELATIPSDVPYIRPQEERVAKWRARVPDNGRLRVGLCWAGSSGHLNDRNRSMALERFAEVLSIRGLDFVSVQKEVSAADAALLREYGVVQLGQEFADFADTAAVVAMLDLIVTVDTAVAHLAGAMGKAAGMLVPFSPDFRWMLDRTDSPWYPTMRLFRQTAIGDWDGPLARLRQELADIARRPPKVAARATACG